MEARDERADSNDVIIAKNYLTQDEIDTWNRYLTPAPLRGEGSGVRGL